jgi:outer membrane protein TolC
MRQKGMAAVFLLAVVVAGVFPLGSREIEAPQNTTAFKESLLEEVGMETHADQYPAAAAGEVVESPLTLTIDEAVERAERYNLGLRSTQLDLQTKRRDMNYAWNSLIPSVSASATCARMNEEQSFSSMTPINESFPGTGIYEDILLIEGDMPRWSLSTGIDVNLTLNLALFDGIKATRLDYEAGLISYETAEKQLERDVRKNFYNLLLLKENYMLMEQQLEAAERRYLQTVENHRNGLVPELSMLSAQVAYENLKPALKEMEIGYGAALSAFKMLIGIDRRRDLELSGEIIVKPVELDVEVLIEERLTARLDIQSLRKTIEILENTRKATISQTMTPNLILGFNVDPSFMGDPFEDPWFEDVEENWSQMSGMFRATLMISLDSFLPFSRTQIQLKGLKDSIRKTKLGMLQAIEGAEIEISILVQRLNKSGKSIESLLLNVELAQRAYFMAEEAYNAGSRELLEVQNAELELRKAKLEVLKERYNYATALLDLEFAINSSIEEIISEVSR